MSVPLPDFIRTDWKRRVHAFMKFSDENCKLCTNEFNTLAERGSNFPKLTDTEIKGNENCKHQSKVECIISTFNAWEYKEIDGIDFPNSNSDGQEDEELLEGVFEHAIPPTVSEEVWAEWGKYWMFWSETLLYLCWIHRFWRHCSYDLTEWYQEFVNNNPKIIKYIEHVNNIKLTGEICDVSDVAEPERSKLLDDLFEELAFILHWSYFKLFLKESKYEILEELSYFLKVQNVCDIDVPDSEEESFLLSEFRNPGSLIPDNGSEIEGNELEKECETERNNGVSGTAETEGKEESEGSEVLGASKDSVGCQSRGTGNSETLINETEVKGEESYQADDQDKFLGDMVIVNGSDCNDYEVQNSNSIKSTNELKESTCDETDKLLENEPSVCTTNDKQNEDRKRKLDESEEVNANGPLNDRTSCLMASPFPTRENDSGQKRDISFHTKNMGVAWALNRVKDKEVDESGNESLEDAEEMDDVEKFIRNGSLSRLEDLKLLSRIVSLYFLGEVIKKPIQTLFLALAGIHEMLSSFYPIYHGEVTIGVLRRSLYDVYAVFTNTDKPSTVAMKRCERSCRKYLVRAFAPTIKMIPPLRLKSYINVGLRMTKARSGKLAEDRRENLIKVKDNSFYDEPSTGVYINYMEDKDIQNDLEEMMDKDYAYFQKLRRIGQRRRERYRTAEIQNYNKDNEKGTEKPPEREVFIKKNGSFIYSWDYDFLRNNRVYFDEGHSFYSQKVQLLKRNVSRHRKINRILNGCRLLTLSESNKDVIPVPENIDKNIEKYWRQRYRLFFRYDEGIVMDHDSWFSVTPEIIAAHQAARLSCDVVVDAFCGAGGNAIQLAGTCSRVIAIDIDPAKIELARQNAIVYGVHESIEFIQGDFFELAPSLKADVVLLSPPWGGTNYQHSTHFDIYKLPGNMNGMKMMDAARTITKDVALYLPKTTNIFQLIELASNDGAVDIEYSHISNKRKSLTAYYGNLAHFNSGF